MKINEIQEYLENIGKGEASLETVPDQVLPFLRSIIREHIAAKGGAVDPALQDLLVTHVPFELGSERNGTAKKFSVTDEKLAQEVRGIVADYHDKLPALIAEHGTAKFAVDVQHEVGC